VELAICNHTTIIQPFCSHHIEYECSVFSLFVASSLLLILGFCCFYCLEIEKAQKKTRQRGGDIIIITHIHMNTTVL